MLTDTTIALPLSQSMRFARVTDGSAGDVLSEPCVYEAVASVVHGSDATVLALGHRRALPKWEGMDMSGLAPAAIRMLLRMSNGHRRMLLRAARSNISHSHQERLNPTVEPLLLRQLWSAIHSKRQLFGQTVQGPSSFFQAVDTDCKGSVGIADLRRAMQRLDVGLSSAQITRLLATIDTDNSGAIEKAELISWMKSGLNSSTASEARCTPAETTDIGLGAGVVLRLRWYAVAEDDQVTDLLTGDRGMRLRKRPGHASAVECDGLSFVEPRSLEELAELDGLRQSVASTLPSTSHVFVTVSARLEGVRGGQYETGHLTLASLAELPAGALGSRGAPSWVRALVKLMRKEGDSHVKDSNVVALLSAAISGAETCAVVAHIGLDSEDTSLSMDILQLAGKLQASNSGFADKRVKQGALPRRDGNDEHPERSAKETSSGINIASAKHTRRRTALSDLEVGGVSNSNTGASGQMLGTKIRPKSAPRERTCRKTDSTDPSVPHPVSTRRSAAVDRRELAQALLDKHFSPDNNPRRSDPNVREQDTASRCAGSVVPEAPRADAEVARLKRALAAALKRCNDSERAHSAVDASLQRVHGQIAELARERSALQSDLRRLNNRYVALATSHARLQAATKQTSTMSAGFVSSPAEDNDAANDPGHGRKAAAESKLAVLTRTVANRHARQHLVPAGGDGTRKSRPATSVASRKPATTEGTIGASGEVTDNDDRSAMSVKEQQLYRQRLSQAESTIHKLKAQVAQQSANQSAMASSLEEMVLENESLRQALLAQEDRRNGQRTLPLPQPPSHSSARAIDMARATAWSEEEQRQGPEEAAVASRTSASKHAQFSQGSDFNHDADEVAQLDHDEAATDMDMEMREY